MRKKYLLLICLFFLCIAGITSAQTTGDYNDIIGQEIQVGIKTNAPEGESALDYEYKERLEARFDVFHPEFRDQLATIIHLDLRFSQLGDMLELRINYTINNRFDSFNVIVPDISSSFATIKLGDRNFTRTYQFQEDVIESTSFSLTINGFFSQFQTHQGDADFTQSITFQSIEPVSYDSGNLPISEWKEVVPLFTADSFVFGASSLLISMSIAGQVMSTSKTGISTTKTKLGEVENLIDETSELVEEHQMVAEGVKATKELGEVGKQSYEITGLLRDERSKDWLTRWSLIGVGIYLVLYGIHIIFSLIDQSGVPLWLNSLYIGYTLIFILPLFLILLVSLVRPKILGKLQNGFPLPHFVFTLLGYIFFILLPLFYAFPELEELDLFSLAFFLFLISITLGFTLLSLFAGYYIGRSGTSWTSIANKGMQKLSFSKKVRVFFIRVVALLFGIFVLSRLIKTIAVILTVFLDNVYSNNSYLITLSASYLHNEMTGPIWLVYGLIVLFFIQAIMSLYIHIAENKVDDPRYQPLLGWYRILSIVLLVTVLSFLHVVLFLESNLEVLGLGNVIIPQEIESTLDVWNLIFSIPPFRLLLDLLLGIGLVIAFPGGFKDMWNHIDRKQSSNK